MTRAAQREEGLGAFSLVELMVTIGLIALLGALLLPAISRSKQKGQKIQCVGNLGQLGLGLQNFVADNHVYPTLFGGTNGDQSYGWNDQLERGGFGISKPKRSYWTEGVWKCPSARWRPEGHSVPLGPPFWNYGYNACGVSGLNPRKQYLGLSGQPMSHAEGCAPIKESEVVVPSDMIAIGDSFDGTHVFCRGFLTYKEDFGCASS